MTQPEMTQVLLMAHGWGYNHRFFDAFVHALPSSTRNSTLFVCLDSGYFPEQAAQGLMIYAAENQTQGQWLHHPAEALHSLVLAHADVPWLGLGHSLGFPKLLEFSVRWHSLFSLHGFTHFTRSEQHAEGTPPRVLARMIQKAEHNLVEVLGNFHTRCAHTANWTTLNEQALLTDLRSMQTLDASQALQAALAHGASFYAWASTNDEIVPLPLAQACFNSTLSQQGNTLFTLAAEHGRFANTPALYNCTLLPLIAQE